MRNPNGNGSLATDRVVVLGAGPAGLSAAYVLSQAGRPTVVLERDSVVGGLARTIEHQGFRFDLGGHRWFTKNEELNGFLRDLLGDELIWVDRISRIYFDGTYFDYPVKLSNALRGIGPVTGARAVADFLWIQARQRLAALPAESMEDAYVNQFGRTLYGLFFKNYSEKVWGRDCREMSGDWVAQRSKGMSLFTALREAVRPSGGKVQSLIERFMYPRHGYGRISERLADGVREGGNEVLLQRRVVSLQHRDGLITGVVANGVRGTEPLRVNGAAFISSIPLTELVTLLEPAAPDAILQAALGLTYRDLITVHLLLDRPQVTPDTWLYVHDRRIGFARFHEPRNWSPAMAPSGRTSLVLEYFCDRGDAIWQMSQRELLDLSVRHLADDLGFIRREEVQGGFALRMKRAYPAYTIGYRENLDAIKSYLARFSNLQIVGRYGTFRYNNADHSMETGILAGRNLLGEHHDLEQVNSAQEYLELKYVSAGETGQPEDAD